MGSVKYERYKETHKRIKLRKKAEGVVQINIVTVEPIRQRYLQFLKDNGIKSHSDGIVFLLDYFTYVNSNQE